MKRANCADAHAETQGSESDGSAKQATSTTDTPPVIQVSGDNPAIVQVGPTYNDLGATITVPQQDLNLGMEASVDGGATTTPDQISVDTSEAGAHTILYRAHRPNRLSNGMQSGPRIGVRP